MLGSSVEPDLLATTTSVVASGTRRSSAATCAGSVESSTCSRGAARLRPERLGQHFGTQARAAHAQQQDVGEAVGPHVGRKRLESRPRGCSVGGRAQPSEPAALVCARPQRRIAGPQASGTVGRRPGRGGGLDLAAQGLWQLIEQAHDGSIRSDVRQRAGFERLDLVQPAHVTFGVGESSGKKRGDQRLGQRRADDARAQHQDVDVIVQHALGRRVGVVAEPGANTRQLVCGDTRAHAAAADDQAALGAAVEHGAAHGLGVVGIVHRLGRVRPEVEDLVPLPLQPLGQMLLQADARVICSYRHSHGRVRSSSRASGTRASARIAYRLAPLWRLAPTR